MAFDPKAVIRSISFLGQTCNILKSLFSNGDHLKNQIANCLLSGNQEGYYERENLNDRLGFILKGDTSHKVVNLLISNSFIFCKYCSYDYNK